MAEYRIQGFAYHLKKDTDLSWLNAFGKIFSVFDQTGSGCIGFGMEKDGHRFFMKIAGADTEEAELTPAQSIALLEAAVEKYEALAHPCLIGIEDAFLKNELFAVMFEWAEGSCLFDHWNFEAYKNDPSLISPRTRFEQLPSEKKLAVCRGIISFLKNCTQKGYVPVDFYDSSIIYDFETDQFRFCDIDLFEKYPVVNQAGEDWWGTKRLKAPEEHIAGSVIDEQTAVFNASALCMDLLSHYEKAEMKKRYAKGYFIPVPEELFLLSEPVRRVLLKGCSYHKEDRYRNMQELEDAFLASILKIA